MPENRPRELLLYGLMEDLKPCVNQLRELGWSAEVRVEMGESSEQRMKVVVEIDLGGIPIPIESMSRQEDS